MATENKWLQTNLKDRLVDLQIDFNVSCKDNSYIPVEFDLACYIVNANIANKYEKMYVPLSGGMDSEFVYLQLKKFGAVPIIVSTPANVEESSHAFNLCKELNVEPIVIEKTEKDIFQSFINDIYKPLNSMGYNSVPALIATRYATDRNGVAIIAEHAYDCLSEWDFYNDILVDEDSSVYYFMWNAQIVDAMQRAYNNEEHQQFKHNLYRIPLRKKYSYKWSDGFNQAINNLAKTRPFRPKAQTKICVRSQSRI